MNTTNQTEDRISEDKFIGNVAHPCKVCGIETHEFRVIQYVKPAITFRYFSCDECDKGKVI